MDKKKYMEKKAGEGTNQTRKICLDCFRSQKTCLCRYVRPFKIFGARFVVLVHPGESRNAVGTGRILKLCIAGTGYLEGVDFSCHDEVNAIIADPGNFCVVLYPGKNSTVLDELENSFVPEGKRLVIFIIDGTWSMAKKMMKLSKNLHPLPRISFKPIGISNYIIRVEPDEVCLSTVEATWRVIDILNSKNISEVSPAGAHQNLLDVFKRMVTAQVDFANNPPKSAYRKKIPKSKPRVFKAKKWLSRSLFYKG